MTTESQAPEGAEWAGAVAFIQHAQNASGSAGADGHWPDEFLAWYKPADWMGEHRAAAVFIGAKIAALAAQPQAAPAITEAEIDRIAALTEKAMEEGLRGFCKTWGWQQFARTLVENLRPYGLRITPKEPTNDR